jgi:hypothetical protein
VVQIGPLARRLETSHPGDRNVGRG